MTTETQKMLDQIQRKIIEIVTHVKFENEKGRTDINDDMERFFKQVLNAHYGCDLKSTNIKISNYPAIDLRDDDYRICYQITSTNTAQKIKSTIETFKDKKMYKDFDELRFLILTDQKPCKVEDPSPEVPMSTSLSIMTLSQLNKEVSNIHSEGKIRKIHRLMMQEYKPAIDPSGYQIKGPARYNFESMQRLFDQAQMDSKRAAKDIKVYEKDFEAFINKLAWLEIDQRLVLQRLVLKSELVPYKHDWLYISSSRVTVEFRGEQEIVDSLKHQGFFTIWHEFSVDNETTFTAICLSSHTKLDLNIFAELKQFSENNDDLLREMIVSLDFKCLEY
ncbi:hypothetical protein EI969_00220 [Pseudomonas sp. PB101]|uniref:SMEK domain-containing protein n=1 Tax=Pseudomonas sp. PB101 TaxID=2495428 RepID=UPI0013661D0E|nr:SMEK domain-containing protein [Pseudomonas sp. PB101]MVW84388.1 hypothetical protein [Pseudomonas sp. PB101]